MSNKHVLVFSEQCPNCVRFIDALQRTSAAGSVTLMDVARLSQEQLAAVQAVPAMVLDSGQTLYGTKAFEWLKQYDGEVELEGFAGGRSSALSFSDVASASGYATRAQDYSAFEPAS